MLTGSEIVCRALEDEGVDTVFGYPGGAVIPLYDALPRRLRGRVDLIAANAPYVPTERIADMPPEAREHEPHVTLDGGADGVDVHRRLAAGAVEWLAPGGVLLVETSPSQAALTTGAMEDAGLVAEVVVDAAIGGCVAVGVSRPAAETA